MATRGDQTRAAIVEAAERLYAARGVDGVSLREINTEAEQRNTNAVHYHFGDRDGLLRALTDKHMPAIHARQQELVEAWPDLAEAAPRDLLKILVGPFLDSLRCGPSERAWARIVGEMASHPDTTFAHLADSATPATTAAGVALLDQMAEVVPRDLALNRLLTVVSGAFHLIADRARREEDADLSRQSAPIELFSEDLLDMMAAALMAPISCATANALVRREG